MNRLDRNRASVSIRRRLTVLLLASVGGLVLLANLILGGVVGYQLQAEYDLSLLAKARALVTLTERDAQGVELDFAEESMPEFEADESPEYFQLWLENGTLLQRSHSLDDSQDSASSEDLDEAAPRYGDLPRFAALSEQPRFRNLDLPDGRSGRSVQIDFLPQIDEDDRQELEQLGQLDQLRHQYASLVVARERERLDGLLNMLYMALFAVSAVLLALIVVIVRVAVGSGLRPLDDIREQVQRLNADTLAMRLVTRQPTLELDAVIRQFNALLDRLEEAFRRERRFTSNVAHELRTPLAELRNIAEVGGRWPDDKKLAAEFFQDVLEAALQMERIVVNLLALARCEEGSEIVETSEIDLAVLVESAWQRVAAQAQAKRLRFHCDSPGGLKLVTGRDQLELILNNLFSNAVAYSSENSAVVCSLVRNENGVTISVSNHTEHLENRDLPLLFDRMWRKDPARSGGHHAGIGLTLVKAYAEQLKLAIGVALETDRIFRISLTAVTAGR